MLNFVICDDNVNILEKLSASLENIFTKYNFDANVSFKTDDVESLLLYLKNNKVDVLFLDISLKGGKSGLDVAEYLRKKNKNTYLIFTTGHLEFAMMAYKFKTFDYIPKPFTSERLEETVIRLFDDIKGLPKKYLKIDNKNTIIDENVIDFIKRDGMKLVFHTSFHDYDTYSSFNKLQNILPSHFLRCHKSYVVNLNNVKNVDFVENRIYFDKGVFCDIGPKYKKDLMEVFKNHGFIE